MSFLKVNKKSDLMKNEMFLQAYNFYLMIAKEYKLELLTFLIVMMDYTNDY